MFILKEYRLCEMKCFPMTDFKLSKIDYLQDYICKCFKNKWNKDQFSRGQISNVLW